jgi:hypothetical protein
MQRPFLTGALVGAGGLLLWYKRGWVISLFRRIGSHFHGADDAAVRLGAAENAVRHIRRYTFAAMQDQSPIVGLTHASYALMGLDLLEETVGREGIQALSGYDPTKVRSIITKLQDKHAEALRGADPYISEVLGLERREPAQLPGFALMGPAPMGA